MYHCVFQNSHGESGFQNESALLYKVSKEEFENQVKNVVALCDIVNVDVTFTFDDGGESFYTIIAPILEKYGLKGIFFISTKFLNTKGFLSNAQVKELCERGHVVGTHSHSHPVNISSLPYERQYGEWKESVEILSNLCVRKIQYASIPNGYYSKKMVGIFKDLGIMYLYTSEPTTRMHKEYGISVFGRYVVRSTTSWLNIERLLSSPYERLMIYLKWRILTIIKYILRNNYNSLKVRLCRS